MPTITLPDAVRGYAYSVGLTASWGTAPYTWTVFTGVLPGGLGLSSGGTVSGTPIDNTGTYEFTTLATDSTATSQTQTYSLLLLPEISITPTVLPDATQNSAYSQQLTATGGAGPFSYALQSGSLPTGITLSGSGLISGTPTGTPGPYNFIVRATDSAAHSLDWSYAIRVIASTAGPSPSFTLAVSTTTVNEGGQVIYTINATNFASGFIYWKNLGTTVAADFTDGLNQGSVQITGSTGQLVRRITSDFRSEITESMDIRLYSGSLTGPQVASTATVTVLDTSTNPRELVSGTLIQADDYNRIQYRVEEILGLGLDGYGLAAVRSTPVADSNVITRSQWNNLLFDLNRIYTHVSGTATNYSQLTATTTVITTTRHVDLFTITNSIYFNEGLRYSCYPGDGFPTQFFNEGGEDTTWRFGISPTTTTVWYGQCDTIFRMRWVTPLLARHFFNAGGQVVWEPVFGPGQAESLSDAEWARFLTLYRNGGYEPYIYKRDDWITTATTKIVTYSSGTKEIVITAEKNLTTDPASSQYPDRIRFSALLRDTAVSEFLVAPEGYRLTPGGGTITPGPGTTATYLVNPSVATVSEGATINWIVTTSGVPNSTELYWTVEGTVSPSDFNPSLPTLSGTVIINNNNGLISLGTLNDGLTEGSDTAILKLRIASTSGPVVATSPTVTISDNPIYNDTNWSVLPEFNPVNENDSFVIEVLAIKTTTLPVGERNWTMDISPPGLISVSTTTGTVVLIAPGEIEWRTYVNAIALARGTVSLTVSNSTGIVASTALVILDPGTTSASLPELNFRDVWLLNNPLQFDDGSLTQGLSFF